MTISQKFVMSLPMMKWLLITSIYDESTKVACFMLVVMSSELQKGLQNHGAFKINEQLKEMLQQ